MHSALAVRVEVSGSQTLRERISLEAELCYSTNCTTETAEINTRLCILLVCFIDEPDHTPRADNGRSWQQ